MEISYEDDDEVMAELRRAREEIRAEFGGNFEAYSAHLREIERRERARGVVYLDQPLRPSRRPKPDAA